MVNLSKQEKINLFQTLDKIHSRRSWADSLPVVCTNIPHAISHWHVRLTHYLDWTPQTNLAWLEKAWWLFFCSCVTCSCPVQFLYISSIFWVGSFLFYIWVTWFCSVSIFRFFPFSFFFLCGFPCFRAC